MKTLKTHSAIALAYFALIALLGLILRLFPVTPISANYKFLVHTHSHIALLGWVYTALSTLIYKLYLQNAKVKKKYSYIFWFTQLTIIGMLVSFPITGYAFFSILFSTLFLLSSYLFTWLVVKFTPQELKKSNSYKLIRTSLWYMVFSSIGPWMLGIVMQTSGPESAIYKNAIYFYLHFQYNGWFIISIIGIVIYLLEQHTELFTKKSFKTFFWLLNSGVIATFLISVFWMKPPIIINIIAGFGGLFQLIAFGILIKRVTKNKRNLTALGIGKIGFLLKVSAVLFLIKLLLQTVACFPFLANVIGFNVDFIIAYIHWIFLGVVSVSIITFMSHYKLIKLPTVLIIGYLCVFTSTESLIVYKGLVAWKHWNLINNYYTSLALVSSLFFIVIVWLCLYQFTRKK